MSGWTRVFELAAESRESLRYGAPSTPTSLRTSSRPIGGQHDTSSEENNRDVRSGEV